MAEVVRRRYSRVLLEARETNPEAAEFSQEETVDGLRRIAGKTSNTASPGYGEAGIEHPASNIEGRKEEAPLVRLPDLIIVDGGKGQLSSACKELQRLGLSELPIIGLAKEHEEIYRPGTRDAFAVVRWIPARCVCCNAFAMKRIGSRILITSC